MPIELNHTIVPARDPEISAQFLAGVRDPDGHLMEILTPYT
jgi:hypothetical protein